ncbi:MAG: hypothetical protein BWY70_00820 [Bacteroidetes bacterium ADurb.Bin408]|nr:MAG: hypothetical protein BWY70_00820 [Bacteroidetes bacterium ADurb.Bin408]
MLRLFSSGTERVFIITTPPEKSPVILGVAVLIMVTLSMNCVGKMSKENALRSASELGSGASFINAALYLSLSPRTTTNLFS